MTFTELPSGIWNAIYDAIRREAKPREVTFGKVVKRDAVKKLVWLKEFGDLAIPLVYFGHSFEYMDSVPLGNESPGSPWVTRKEHRGDKTQKNDAFHTTVIVPSVGQMVCVLNPRGSFRFPMCVGVIQSKDYWLGEV